MRIPTHPGALLREDIIPAIDMTISQVADALGISRQTLHRILAETAPVTPEMAVRLGKFVGDGPDAWTRMRAAHAVANASVAMANHVNTIPTVSPRPASAPCP